MPEKLTTSQKNMILQFARKLSDNGIPCMVHDGQGNVLFPGPDSPLKDISNLCEFAQSSASGKSFVINDSPNSPVIEAGFCHNNHLLAALTVDACEAHHPTEKTAVAVASFSAGHENSITNTAISDSTRSKLVFEWIQSFIDHFDAQLCSEQQMELISTELAQTYEELVLLYNMSTNARVTQSNANYLQMACDQLTQLVEVEGIAVFLNMESGRNTNTTALTAGAGVLSINPQNSDIIEARLTMELDKGKEALIDSNVDGDFQYEWSENIHNILVVPLKGNEKLFGFMVATNRIDKADFDSIDVKLFNSVANQCAVFIDNNRLVEDLKDLFIGSLKALTHSIDAKDQYTRGHSERVAFIARWIAERYAEKHDLSQEEIHRIYLAGLLHDIGKIGIEETVLRKRGKLSDVEADQIRSHPRIGGTILSDIKQMKTIVPGIMHHHERVDGRGYPDGLRGEQIPLIARIISLADSFDAMTSKRVYRDAMSIKRAVAEIEKSLGTQFDEEVGRVFIESDLQKLWNIIQDGFIESWDYSNFDEYGIHAVGTLLR